MCASLYVCMKLSRDSLRTLHAINYKVLYPPNSIYIYVPTHTHTRTHTHTHASPAYALITPKWMWRERKSAKEKAAVGEFVTKASVKQKCCIKLGAQKVYDASLAPCPLPHLNADKSLKKKKKIIIIIKRRATLKSTVNGKCQASWSGNGKLKQLFCFPYTLPKGILILALSLGFERMKGPFFNQ